MQALKKEAEGSFVISKIILLLKQMENIDLNAKALLTDKVYDPKNGYSISELVNFLILIDENKSNRGKKIRIKNDYEIQKRSTETPFEYLSKTGSWEPFYFDENGSQIQPEVSAT